MNPRLMLLFFGQRKYYTDQIINVGINPVGCVFSEFSLQDPKTWNYIRPILRENDGWAAFNFTPYEKNHAYDLYLMAKNNPDWFCQKPTIDDTKVLGSDRPVHDWSSHTMDAFSHYPKQEKKQTHGRRS